MKKPLSPLAHGILDYALVVALLTVPTIMKMNKKAARIYGLLGTGLGTYVAATDHGASVVPAIPFDAHYKIDHANLASLSVLAFHKDIRKDKKALLFHTAFLSLSFMTVLLTDPKKGKEKQVNLK